MQALEVAGSDSLILRRTFPELEKSIIEPMRKYILPLYEPAGARFNDAKSILRLPNGSNVYFGYCRSENDVYQYQGGEFLFIGIDELTHFTLKQWQFLTSRNRCAVKQYTAGVRQGQKVLPCMAGATNPGNIGHAWVKALWIDKQAPKEWDSEIPYDPREYDFIKARISDNPIYATDESYLKTLNSLPNHLRKAMLEGDWNVFAGQYFDIFSRDRHVRQLRSEDWYNRWVSIDWGFKHPSAVYWHTRLTDDSAFTYREYVKSGLSPKMLAQAIVEQSEGERINVIYLSPDAFAQRTSENSIALEMAKVFQENGLPAPTIADDSRVSGWQLMYQLLETDMWTIAPQCKELIHTLPMLVYDEKHIEDVAKMDGDDSADAARYGIFSQIRIAPKPRVLQMQEKLGLSEAQPTITKVEQMQEYFRQVAKPQIPVFKIKRNRFGRRM